MKNNTMTLKKVLDMSFKERRQFFKEMGIRDYKKGVESYILSEEFRKIWKKEPVASESDLCDRYDECCRFWNSGWTTANLSID